MKIIICTLEQNSAKSGIHLNNPDYHYISWSISEANTKGFDSIYCHYDHDGFKYKLNCSTLIDLFDLAKRRDIKFIVENTASPQAFIDNIEKTR